MVWKEIIKWIGGDIKLPKAQDWKAQCVRKTEDQFSFSMEGGGMENQVGPWIEIRKGLECLAHNFVFYSVGIESRDHIKTLFYDA